MPTVRQVRQQKKAFLEHFAEYGNVSQAAAHAGVARQSVYRWQEQDDQFAAAYREAELQATEVLEAEARRRAVEGLRRLKFDKGEAVLDPATGEPYTELEYSDTLLIFLLKARAPEKYRENVNVTFELRQQAERLAAELGLDPAEVLAEAERLVRAGAG